MLNLEKGTFETFTKAVTGISDMSPLPKIKPNEKYMNSPEKSYQLNKSEAQLMTHQDNFEFEEEYELSEPVKPKRVSIDLKSMDVCRICLQNDKNMLNIFRKLNFEDYTPADLMDYCLSMNLDSNDLLPKQICHSCFESVKIACNLISFP